jgi:hypothetical protein
VPRARRKLLNSREQGVGVIVQRALATLEATLVATPRPDDQLARSPETVLPGSDFATLLFSLNVSPTAPDALW